MHLVNAQSTTLNNTHKTYILATKHNVTGAIVHLDIPPMAMQQAVKHRDKLLALMPSATVYVINTQSE